jgi:quercetin dioxygenase-like cupin family protein
MVHIVYGRLNTYERETEINVKEGDYNLLNFQSKHSFK